MTSCTHLQGIDPHINAKTKGCEEGEKTAEAWIALRKCLTCGHIGCCDSSPGRHARQHFQDSGHPIIDSFQPEGAWQWCYLCDDYIQLEEKTDDFNQEEAIILD